MQPVWRPDGQTIAWIAWNHPNMPWDGTRLMLGELSISTGSPPVLARAEVIAGDEQTAIFQPQFSPDGASLAYVSDASGWQQLMLFDLTSGKARQLTHAPAEHGEPAWVQGRRTYAFSNGAERVFFLRNQNSRVGLWQMDLKNGQEREIALGEQYTYLEQIAVSEYGLAVIASGSATPARLLAQKFGAAGEVESARIVRRSSAEEFGAQWFSQPEPVEWRSPTGQAVYGLYYPPHHPRARGEGAPPLIVSVHGGPTGQVFQSYDLETQFFTSRGYAVLAINFRGSAGYGRAYRNLLRGAWGVVDVEDAVNGAQAMVAAGLADGNKLIIMGSSSGGMTVLKALEDDPGFFKAGICRYGVSNQFSLAMDTHKFELHYSDSLLGPLPQAAEIYRQRSPVYFADRIQDALALFQGEDDNVVPRRQSDEVAAILSRRGVPHVYHVYPGEGHGFRKPETLEHYYRTVERFLLEHVIWA
jgi:dipeptidyl aminopeptidase/acylaminoacyl peptidase